MKIIILTLFGILAGLLSSLLGQSPAIIILPMLLLFKIVKNYKVAVGLQFLLYSYQHFLLC